MRLARYASGFTLLEMLLVLVVISVMAGLASVMFEPNPYNTLNREARRLQAVMQMASDEAVLQGTQWSLGLPEQGYQFLVFDNDQFKWTQLEIDPFDRYILDNNIALTLTVEGEQLDPQTLEQIQRLQSLNTEQSVQPALLLLSNGEITPFSITLRYQNLNNSVTLRSDGVSPIELVEGVNN